MSSMTTRTTRSKTGVIAPVETKGPPMKDKNFFDLKKEGYSVVVFFMNGEEQFAYQYDLDKESKYDVNLLLNNSINVTFQYVQTKIRQMMAREYTVPNINPETNEAYPESENKNDEKPTKDVTGVCVGEVGQSFLSSQYRKGSNDTFVLFIDHKEKKFVGYIVANRVRSSDKETYSYYIDIICAEAGYGSLLLEWFINFFFRETNNKKDPAYNVESLSLSALSSVLTYYTRFGYLHVENCEEKEIQEIVDARKNLPKANKKPQRTAVEFINFLFLLTRQGFNATENPICKYIAQGNIDDEMKDGDRFKTISAYDKYTDYMNDLKEKMKSKNKGVVEQASKLYKEITNLEKDYEESFEAYQDNKTIENKKKYFDATFKYAKYLYIDIGGCDNNGYYMKRCERPPKFSFDSCW